MSEADVLIPPSMNETEPLLQKFENTSHVLVIGTLGGGISNVVGPFANRELAEVYVIKNLTHYNYTIQPLEEPVEKLS